MEWRSGAMSPVKWRIGKNGENLTGKVKMAYIGKDHTKVDRNFIDAR